MGWAAQSQSSALMESLHRPSLEFPLSACSPSQSLHVPTARPVELGLHRHTDVAGWLHPLGAQQSSQKTRRSAVELVLGKTKSGSP